MHFRLQTAQPARFHFDHTRKCEVRIVKDRGDGFPGECGQSPACLIHPCAKLPGTLQVCEGHLHQANARGIELVPWQAPADVPEPSVDIEFEVETVQVKPGLRARLQLCGRAEGVWTPHGFCAAKGCFKPGVHWMSKAGPNEYEIETAHFCDDCYQTARTLGWV